MPFYKCYGCMKTFHSEGRVTACKYCHKILSESINRAPNPPRLQRRHSAPVLGALTQEQEVRRVEIRRQPRRRFTPQCPWCYGADSVTCFGKDESGLSKNGKFYACGPCQVLFIWDSDIQFDVRLTYLDVGDRMKPLNIIGFRCLGLEQGLLAVANIFRIGFQLKSNDNLGYRTTVYNPIVQHPLEGLQSFPKSGDIMPDTGHCFARTLPGCTTFPNDVSKTDTYLFVCILRYGFDTHAQQRREVGTILSYYPGLEEHRDKIEWPLHALEVAVDSVAPEDILACIPCKKYWRSEEWSDGGAFTLDLDHIMFRKYLPLPVQKLILLHCTEFAKGVIPPTSQ